MLLLFVLNFTAVVVKFNMDDSSCSPGRGKWPLITGRNAMSEYNTSMSDDERRMLDAQLQDYEDRGVAAQAKAAQAYGRLLHLAETRDSGQIRYIARFLASTYNGTAFPWNPFELRGLDVEIGDDMLACLDALRWAKTDLHRLVPEGEKRVEAVIELWGLQWPASD